LYNAFGQYAHFGKERIGENSFAVFQECKEVSRIKKY